MSLSGRRKREEGTIENLKTLRQIQRKRLPLSFRLTGGMKMAIKIGRMRESTKICKTIFLIRDVFRLLRCESCATFSCHLASSRPLNSTSTGLIWLYAKSESNENFRSSPSFAVLLVLITTFCQKEWCISGHF